MLRKFLKKNLKTVWQKEDAYSLAELMVVLVIIGILLLLAIPQFRGVTSRARETEAKMALQNLHTLQYAYQLEHDSYAKSLDDLRFEVKPTTLEGGAARYQIIIEKADIQNYTAIAKAVVDTDGDGVFNIWEVDKSGMVKERTED